MNLFPIVYLALRCQDVLFSFSFYLLLSPALRMAERTEPPYIARSPRLAVGQAQGVDLGQQWY